MDTRTRIIGIGLIAGLNIGIVVGAVTDNMGFWIAIGTAIGLILGAAIATLRTRQAGEE